MALSMPAIGDEFLDKLKESASNEIEKSETDALFKQAELSQRYVTTEGARSEINDIGGS
jgi:hypothetical protein